MSIAQVPEIAEWINLGLNYMYIDPTIIGTRSVPANGQLQLPIEDFTFHYPEIVLMEFVATFDSPKCGIRVEGDPSFDTEEFWTVDNMVSGGLQRVDKMVYATLPPYSPLGRFSVRTAYCIMLQDWMRLYLINTDSEDHNVLSHGYRIAVLRQERPELSDSVINTARLTMELYPETKQSFRAIFIDKVKKWVRGKDYFVEIAGV